MSFTYSPPVDGGWANPVHEVRFLARNRVNTPQSLDDDEVALLVDRALAAWGDPLDLYAVAAQVAEAMADSYITAMGGFSKAVGNVSLSRTYGGEADAYRALSARLWARASHGKDEGTTLHGLGLAAGGSQAPRSFAIGHLDSPGSGQLGSGRGRGFHG